MKVLFIYPPNNRPTHIIPLGLGYIGAVLRQHGYEVQALDIDAYRFSPGEIGTVLEDVEYDVVCLSGLISVFNSACWLAREVKRAKPHAKVLAGGPLVSSLPHLLVGNSEVDVGATGEGEEVVLQLMRAFETNARLDDIPGIVFKRDGQVVQTKPAPRIKDVDAIPFPAHDLWPTQIYLKRRIPSYFAGLGLDHAPHMGMLGSRGCPYPCTYCDRAFGKLSYFRSVENIMEEIAWLKKDYGVKLISFVDDYFFPDEDRIYELCDAFRRRHPDIRWHCLGRVDKVDPKQLRAMAQAGCVTIAFGIETGSPTMLKEMKKRTTVEQGLNAVRWAREAGVNPHPSFLLGMPGETEETMRETLEFRKELNRYLPRANENTFWVAPLPGTELYAYCKRVGLIKDDLEYIIRYSDIHTIWKFFMNLTRLPDEKIIALKARHQREIFWDYYEKHPEKFIRGYVWPRLLKYSGVELVGRAVHKALRIHYKRQSLAATASGVGCRRSGWIERPLAWLEDFFNVGSKVEVSH